MHNVANNAVISDCCRVHRGGVNDRSVLDAGACPNNNIAVIAAQYCPGPDGGLWSDGDTPNYYCIGMNIGSGVNAGNLGSKSVNRHIVMLLMVKDARLTMSLDRRNISNLPLAFHAYVSQD
jgi:hypothetical protein